MSEIRDQRKGRPSVPLGRLSDEEVSFYCSLRAREIPRAKAVRMLYEAYPKAYEYQATTGFSHFDQSPYGRRMLKKIRSKVAAGAVEESFSIRGIRVKALTEVARMLFERILEAQEARSDTEEKVRSDGTVVEKPKDNTGPFVKLCDAFRAALREVREEVDPLSTEDQRVMSSFQRFLVQREAELNKAAKAAIGEKDWLQKSTSEIPSN